MNEVVRARIDGRVKKAARAVLKQIGLTKSDAFRMMMMRIAAEKKLPFEPLVLGPKSVAAKKELARGKGARFRNVDELMADLKS